MSKWIEPTTHDIGILPGGYVIHYSVCWCKKAAKPATPPSKEVKSHE